MGKYELHICDTEEQLSPIPYSIKTHIINNGKICQSILINMKKFMSQFYDNGEYGQI